MYCTVHTLCYWGVAVHCPPPDTQVTTNYHYQWGDSLCITRSPAVAEGPRDAGVPVEICQLLNANENRSRVSLTAYVKVHSHRRDWSELYWAKSYKLAAQFIYIMRMGLKANVVSVTNIIIVSDFERMLLITAVSYTHLTLPTNREV